jgi:hypothetical protein
MLLILVVIFWRVGWGGGVRKDKFSVGNFQYLIPGTFPATQASMYINPFHYHIHHHHIHLLKKQE